ncbi:hypothetical protein [Ligilactobacillus ruminis]|uniref:hypothetical protein n=1 Tax=Ligilactobacillus ruminis TaxID=1623 RepID=UPI00177F8D9F|nr:hypothetical protein [Ligilactobacillus ruminis]
MQSIANLIRFFCVCMTIAFQDENNPKQFLMAQRADLSGAAFGKITAVYGQIAENGPSVRKWLARKKAITDKMGKNSRLSVKIQTFRTRVYGQMLQKAACVRKSSA